MVHSELSEGGIPVIKMKGFPRNTISYSIYKVFYFTYCKIRALNPHERRGGEGKGRNMPLVPSHLYPSLKIKVK